MLKFVFLEKGLGIISPSHVANNFSRKMFLMLYSINWPTLIVWFAFTSWDIEQHVHCNYLFPTIPQINFDSQSLSPFSILFASISENFLAQASMLLLFQYVATPREGRERSDLFLQSGPFQTWVGLKNLYEILSQNMSN